MPSPSIKVEGLRELNKAFGQVQNELKKELSTGLKKIAEPVAVTARGKALTLGFGAKTASGFAAGSRSGGAVVRQRRKRTTGFHPGFAGLQMRKVLEPSLAENEDRVIREVGHLLDDVIDKAGF